MGALGVDSLLALEFVRRLSGSTGAKLPATAVFNYPTPRLLANEIARRLGAAANEPQVGPSPGETAPALDAPELSEEDAVLALMGSSESIRPKPESIRQ